MKRWISLLNGGRCSRYILGKAKVILMKKGKTVIGNLTMLNIEENRKGKSMNVGKKILAALSWAPLLSLTAVASSFVVVDVYTDMDNVMWRYYISNDSAIVMSCHYPSGECTLPASIGGWRVSSFYSDTFYNCAVTNFIIPANFTGDVSGALFHNQKSLISVTVSDANARYSSENGILLDKNRENLIYVPPRADVAGIPNTVTNIYKQALISRDKTTVQWLSASVDLLRGDDRDVQERYRPFIELSNGNYSQALRLPSGKRDAAGRPMYVWQDYVMGTDPTDTNDVFQATISIENGEVEVSWSPQLPAAEAAKRVYTIYGSTELPSSGDAEWTPIPDGTDKSAYRFFKVGVEIR